MGSTHSRPPRAAFVAALGLSLVVGACACENDEPQPKVPDPSLLIGRTNMQPAPGTIPNTPTAANVSIATEILRDCNIPDSEAYSEFDSSQLMSFDHAPLDALAACFVSGPMRGKKLNLVGHADPRGAQDYSLTLGKSRADAVEAYLSDRGLERSRMTATSRGSMDATGRTETGWAHDRRVDIVPQD
jgi:peptidoglycan-associated lipoprotein